MITADKKKASADSGDVFGGTLLDATRPLGLIHVVGSAAARSSHTVSGRSLPAPVYGVLRSK
jgi:hypothetical protein